MNLIDALKVNGKAHIERLDPKTHVLVENEMFIIRSTFDDGSTADAQLTLASMILSEEWVSYTPPKPPCEHEPEQFKIITYTVAADGRVWNSELCKALDQAKTTICKHCGQKLKPTGWELV